MKYSDLPEAAERVGTEGLRLRRLGEDLEAVASAFVRHRRDIEVWKPGEVLCVCGLFHPRWQFDYPEKLPNGAMVRYKMCGCGNVLVIANNPRGDVLSGGTDKCGQKRES